MATGDVLDTYGASTAFTITLASLASSAAGVGRQSTFVDNETTRYMDLLVFLKIQVHSSAVTADTTIDCYLLRGDDHTENVHTDDAGDSDAGITIKNATKIGSLRVTAVTADLYYTGEFLIHRPGPSWAIAVVQNTGQVLGSTEGNHIKRWVGLYPQVQS